MSYGIWRTRGQGWSAIEIDSPGNDKTIWDLRDQDENARDRLARDADRYGVEWDGHSDLAAVRWLIARRKNNPTWKIMTYYPGGGEHQAWVAFQLPEVLKGKEHEAVLLEGSEIGNKIRYYVG